MTANVDTEKMTVATFHQMEFDEDDTYQYELLDGDIVKKNDPTLRAPAPHHQRLVRKLLINLQLFVEKSNLGEMFDSPIDVFLDEFTAPQPDLVFIATDKAHLITDDGIMGAPTFVVEIISPTSVYRDRVTKKALYERFGIGEYWLVDPADAYIEIFSLANGRYELLSAASVQEGTLTSAALPGLALDLAGLFAE